MLLLYILLVNLFRSGLVLAGDSPSSQWGYDPSDGPDTWTGKCATGARQSPVDLRPAEVDIIDLPPLHFRHYDAAHNVTLSNNGHSVVVGGFESSGRHQPYIYGAGLKDYYKLVQFHLHWSHHDSRGSEHTLAGLHYAAELHLVHLREGLTMEKAVNVSNGLAVVAIFLRAHTDALPLQSLASSFGSIEKAGSSVQVREHRLRPLLPLRPDAFYRYHGSLTTPACAESVVWTILADPIDVSHDQLTALRRVHNEKGHPIKYNHRPVQPLRGRTVHFRPADVDALLRCSSPSIDLSIFVILFASLHFFFSFF